MTVEDCTVLDISLLTQRGVGGPNCAHRADWLWLDEDDQVRSSIGLLVRTGPDSGSCRLMYGVRRAGQPDVMVDYDTPLVTTAMPTGGRRWWFLCPTRPARSAQVCHRRVGKLYRPSGRTYFGCRECHRLTYESRNDGDWRRWCRLLGLPGGPSGRSLLNRLEGEFRADRRMDEALRQRARFLDRNAVRTDPPPAGRGDDE